MKKKGTVLLFMLFLGVGCSLIYFGVRAELAKDAQILYEKNTEQLNEINDNINTLFP